MVICKALGKIRTRENGVRVLYEKGDLLTVTHDESVRLQKLKVIVIEEVGEDVEDEKGYLSEQELKEKNKDSLIAYAKTIGLPLDKSLKRDVIIHTILDYSAEQQALTDDEDI